MITTPAVRRRKRTFRGGTARDRKTDKAKKRKGNKSSGLSEVSGMADGRGKCAIQQIWHDVTLAKSGDTLL